MRRFPLLSILLLIFIFAFSVSAQDTLYTSKRGVRVRAEATTTATVVTTLAKGTAVTVISTVDGTRVSGSTVWYQVSAGQFQGYIHSSLLTNVASAAPVTTGSTAPVQNVQSTPAPLVEQPVAPPAGASCNGARTCGDMSTCEQAYACLAGGRSSLDRDKDGVPCEDICPGG